MVNFLKRLFGFIEYPAGPKHMDLDEPPEMGEPALETYRELYFDEMSQSDEPWAVFEINGFTEDSQIKVDFNCNSAFISKINALGFFAETEEDTVQLFFFAGQMKPTELIMDLRDGAGEPTAEDYPPLLSPTNRIVK